MHQTHPGPKLPHGVRTLLGALLHSTEGDEVLADLGTEYAARQRDGVWRARVWLAKQVVGSLPALVKRSWFRGTTGFESEANRMRGGSMFFESWIVDFRFAWRGLVKRPQYVMLAVLTLALGIGGTTAVFGIARAILMNPLPYRESGELEMFWSPFDWNEAEVSFLRDDWPGFTKVAAYRGEGVFLRTDAQAKLVPGIASSAELFEVLGTGPLLGRVFQTGDDVPGAELTAVLSYSLWQELGGSRDVVGSVVDLDGVPRRVVGVMPERFWFPDPSVRVWLSTPMRPDNRVGNYALIGRRAPGYGPEAMAEPLRRITTRMGEQFTYSPQWDRTKNAELTPIRESLLGPVRPTLVATLAGMAVILLMACANVATLMLGQLRGRSSELAVRLALGAGRRRLTQQLITESMLLALLSGIAGALAAIVGFKLLLAWLPLGELSGAAVADWRIFATALVIALVSALLIAMAPVFSLWRGDLRSALTSARSGGIGVQGGRLENSLVIAEVALAVLLAAGAAVLIRSVDKLHAIDPGVSTRGIAVLDISSSSDVPGEQRKQQLLDIVAALRTLPGVTASASTQVLPLHGRGHNFGINIESKPEIERNTTAYRMVTRDFFKVMGIRLLRGRTFDETDNATSEPVVVIDEALAKKYFPGEDALGQRISFGMGPGWARIIGVVSSVTHTGLTEEPGPGRYMLADQLPIAMEANTLVLRVAPGRNPASVLREAQLIVERTSQSVAVHEATTMENIFAVAMGPTWRVMQLMALLGALALTLGAVGVYGVVSHFVNRRRRDWMIRLALGMKPIAAIRQVVGRGTTLVAMGCVIGIIAALLLTRLLDSLLYQVDAADPAALIAATITLIATGAIAALVPALRASRTNPAQVLRETP